MVKLFCTDHISVDLAKHGLFRAKVGKGGIMHINELVRRKQTHLSK